jgi:IS6 family transposase
MATHPGDIIIWCVRWYKRCRKHLKPTNRSWWVEQTYIKVKGQERFLYRAVDSSGQTIDFLLTAKRDTGMAGPGNSLPRGINVDKNRAYLAAVDELKKDGSEADLARH